MKIINNYFTRTPIRAVIDPSNAIVHANYPVHNNIRIENNVFRIFDYSVLFAKSMVEFTFIANMIERTTLLGMF